LTRAARTKKFPFVASDKLERAAVICHRNADADAYLSAYALSRLLTKIAPKCKVDIATPGGMTALTTKLKEQFDHAVVEESETDYDLYIAVDVGDTELLKTWLSKMEHSHSEKILVDHHPLRNRDLYSHTVVNEDATSAAEVVFGIYAELGVDMDKKTAQALLEGILFDSQHLSIAGAAALNVVVALLHDGADLDEARRSLRSQPDYGEVMAKLKGSRRMKIFRIGDWTAVTSEVGSFQAQVARSLIFLGADVAAVGGQAEGEARVSLRSSQRFLDQTKIKLGTDIAEFIARMREGHGGGHSTAASFTLRGDNEDAAHLCIERLAELLGAQILEIK
jgi:nanoRNase/pAp phosphatase (c-di-AMP/oligoRNAs hydrolase)